MAFHMDCVLKIITFLALLRVSLGGQTHGVSEHEPLVASNVQALASSLLPTEVTVTKRQHQQRSSGDHHASTAHMKESSKSKDAFLGMASTQEATEGHAVPSSFLAASASSSAASSSMSAAYASLMTDRSLEPLEDLELDSTLEGLGQHSHDSGEEGYHIDPDAAPRFPGSVLETGGESTEKGENDDRDEDKDNDEDKDANSDQEDYEGLGLSASDSKSMRDVFRASGGKAKHAQTASTRTHFPEDETESLLEGVDLSANHQKPRRTAQKIEESESLSNSLLDDIELPKQAHRNAPVAPWEEEENDEDEGARQTQDEVSKEDAEDQELLRRDSSDDIAGETTQSLKSLREALEGSSVTELNGGYHQHARPKHAKTKQASSRSAETDSEW